MLDLACIFTTSGVILFYKTFCDIGLAEVNAFIRSTILQDKLTSTTVTISSRSYHFSYSPSRSPLVFLFIYQSLYSSSWGSPQQLLSVTRRYYMKSVYPEIVKTGDLYVYIPDFAAQFDKIVKKVANDARKARKINSQPTEDVPKEQQGDQGDIGDIGDQGDEADEGDEGDEGDEADEEDETDEQLGLGEKKKKVSFEEKIEESGEEKELKKLTAKEKLELRKRQKKSNKDGDSKSNNSSFSPNKKQRDWGGPAKVTKESLDALDMSAKIRAKHGGKIIKDESERLKKEFFDEGDEINLDFEVVSEDEEDETSNNQYHPKRKH